MTPESASQDLKHTKFPLDGGCDCGQVRYHMQTCPLVVTKFVRVGTLDHPDALPPDVHIFAATKQPWFDLPQCAPTFSGFYERDNVWPPSSLARIELLAPAIEAYRRQNA